MGEQDIGLQELIEQVKRELLAPNPAARARDPYPLFVIDSIELEIAVKVSRSGNDSIKLTVLDFAEVGVDRSLGQEQGHVVKVKLLPLLSREEILAEAQKDTTTKRMIEQTVSAWVKSPGNLKGEAE